MILDSDPQSMLSFPPAANGNALVAQLDRAPDYESGGQGFESLRVYHFQAHSPGGFAGQLFVVFSL